MIQPRAAVLRTRSRLVVALVAPLAVLASAAAPDLSAASAPGGADRAAASARETVNPLALHRWGVYKGAADQSWIPYTKSSGAERRLLGK